MQAELRGSVPKLPYAFTKTLVNRAYKNIRLANLWSFNVFESSWITPPPIINVGTVTTTQGLPTITFDATAIAAINANQIANAYSLITQRQFRVAVGGIYNILTYSPVSGVATLDRIYGDPSGAGQAFQLYQIYYTPPMLDFKTWISIRNPSMYYDLILNMTRGEVDARDPQRTIYMFPTHAVPFGTDTRGAGTANASATLNFPLYELWGQPVSVFTYQCYGIRDGVDLSAPDDTLPPTIAEETVLALARAYAYEWAEANKDIAPRNSGPDFRFLIGQTMGEYKKLLVRDRLKDRNFIDNYFTSHDLHRWGGNGFYDTRSKVASTSVGGQ